MDERTKGLWEKIKGEVVKSGLTNVDKEVISFLYEYLEIYIKSVIQTLSRHKKKYDVVCPLLKPVSEPKKKIKCVREVKSLQDNEQDYIKTKVLLDDDPFTAKDLLECYKEYPQIIPRRNIFQVHLLHVTKVASIAENKNS